MTREELATAMDKFILQFTEALHGNGQPPQPPDFSNFTPTTDEDYQLISTLITRLSDIEEQTEQVMLRTKTALEAPRLNRLESTSAGRTLFGEA